MRIERLGLRALAAGLGVALVGCSPATTLRPEAREGLVTTDDMSVQEHRAAAQRHDDIAKRYQGKPDPSFAGEVAAPYGDRVSGRQHFIGETSSGLRVTRAKRHERHARQHQQAAEQLETFEAGECATTPSDDRATCPLLRSAVRIEDTSAGVRVFLVEGENSAQVAQHMRCHHAFGRSRRFQQMDACPLYLRPLRIDVVAPNLIELTSNRTSTKAELQRRARDHVASSTTRPVQEAP